MKSSKGALPDPSRVALLMQTGRWAEAEAACRRLAKADRRRAGRHLAALGQILMAQNRAAEAETVLRRAAADHPRSPEPAAVLAHLARLRGRRDEALGWQQKAAAAAAEPSIHLNLAAMLTEAGRHRDALNVYIQLTKTDCTLLAGWEGVAALAARFGEFDDVVDARRRLAELRGTAEDWWALGQLEWRLRLPQALNSLEKADALGGGDSARLSILGRALADAGRAEQALACHGRASAAAPDSPWPRLAQAGTLAVLGRAEEAKADYAALAGDVDLADSVRARALYEWGALDLAEGRAQAAAERMGAAVALDPSDRALHFHHGQALLLAGDLRAGWPEFAYRFSAGLESGGILAQPLPQPSWNGEDLDGKTILVWGEQGIGDDILHASVLRELSMRAARVLVHTDARLAPVLRRSLPANVTVFPRIERFQPELLDPSIHFQCASGEVVRRLRADWSAFPAEAKPYLEADPALTAAARARYAALPGRRIGLAWRSKNLVNGVRKSCGLEYWDPILTLPGLSFVCLQYGDVTEEIEAAQARTGCRIHVDPEVDQMSDMEGFFAQAAALDGVVSISNATVHVAGALGVPTLLLLASSPLWTWFLDREDSPWYGSARLIRQQRCGDWSAVIAEAAARLAAS